MKTVPAHIPSGYLALLAGVLLCGLGCTVRVGSNTFESRSWMASRTDETKLELELSNWDEPINSSAPLNGSWTAKGGWLDDLGQSRASNRWVHLHFHTRLEDGRSFDYGAHSLRASDFRTVPVELNGLHLVAELSTARLLLRGEHSRSQAAGQFEIVPDAAFLKRGGELLEGDVTLGQLLRFGMRPEPLAYIELLAASSNRWTWADALHLYQRGVDPQFIQALRRPAQADSSESSPAARRDPPPREPFSANDLVHLHSRGVSANYVEALDAAGTAFSATEIVHLHSRGVSTSFVRDVTASGLAASASDLVLLSSRGLPAQYIVDVRASGYDYAAHELVLLHSRGVPVSYAQALKREGYHYSASDVVLLHSRGVPIDYLASLANAEYQPLAASEVLRLHSAGVPSEMVKRLRR